MLTRRSLLQSSIASALGLLAPNLLESDLAKSERCLVGSVSLDLADRSRTLIHPDFYPIYPDRVVVIGGDDGLPRNTEEHRLRIRLASEHGPAARKLNVIFQLMHVLTNYYRRPQLFERWVSGVAKRESLGSAGVGGGFGLLHQFQDDGHVRPVNPPVDWWLFLFPDGVDWDAWDEKPVYGMIGHVFPPPQHRLPGPTMWTYALTSFVARLAVQNSREADLAAWQRIARMDRTTATRTANLAFARGLAESPLAGVESRLR
jgi:hypothetical protein